MANVLMILSGCGVFDGSEIHEAVCALLHLDRHDATVTMAAPDISQSQVVDHLTGKPTGESRNVRVEAARIARGAVENLADVHGSEFDAVLLPGGFGAATNLCDFATRGEECEVNAEVSRVLGEAHAAGRPIGFICIAPTIAARLFSDIALTIGSDTGTAEKIVAMGCRHEDRATRDICTDESSRIVSTPAYMTAQRIGEVYEGIGNLVDEVMALVSSPAAL